MKSIRSDALWLSSLVVVVGLLIYYVMIREADSGNLNMQSYRNVVRIPVFSALITLGSFLLTLQTSMLQRLKESFKQPIVIKSYRKLLEDCPDISNPPMFYGALLRLSYLISFCIVASFFAALMHMMLGFVSSLLLLAFSISLSLLVFGLVVFLVVKLAQTHSNWISSIENEDEIQELKTKVREERSRPN